MMKRSLSDCLNISVTSSGENNGMILKGRCRTTATRGRQNLLLSSQLQHLLPVYFHTFFIGIRGLIIIMCDYWLRTLQMLGTFNEE